MIQHKFGRYRNYLLAQRRGSSRAPNRQPEANPEEIATIAKDIRSRGILMPDGICHGSRCGTEIDLFHSCFDTCNESCLVVGTDLVANEHPDMIKWDFQKQKDEWVGAFDFVYSNSLDHASHPRGTLRLWLDQLQPNGRLYVKWTSDYKLENRRLPHPGGDCFGASLEEYLLMLKEVGWVVDVLYLGGVSKRIRVVIVVKKKENE